MPRGDRTGPSGFGMMTGRGLGYCAGYDAPGYVSGGFGGRGFHRNVHAGYGRGFGRGMGVRRGFAYPPDYGWDYPAYSEEDEKEYLKNQAQSLQDQLNRIEKRLSEMEESD